MSIVTDSTYIRLLSHRLRNFKQKKENLWNFSCPICGDSKKNKTKARGYVFAKKQDLFYQCHNCGVGLSLGNLIKTLDPQLYKEYAFDRYKEGNGISRTNLKAPEFEIPAPKFGKMRKQKTFEHADWIDKLPSGHFCLSYVEGRKIPKTFYDKLLYTDNFKLFCDSIFPEHNKEELPQDQRLIIPFYDEYNELIGIAGRALATADHKLRYVKIKANETVKKLVYGLDRIDTTRTVKIVEGELDSIFLDNCVASGDSSLTQTAGFFEAENKILIFDNEPRNKEILKLMKDAIESNYNIVIWPSTIEQKDINDMVKSGLSPDEIETIISNNTFKGIEAHTRFTFWKRI